MPDLTIAIPTFNGETRLPAVLEALRQQKQTAGIDWEVLVVDNNSHDRTREVVENQANFPVPLRYCFEPKQGLAHARQRAIQTAESELIGFVDDDNLPEPNWVKAVSEFAQKHPQAGAFGSRIIGEFTTEPPPNFARIAAFLALTDRGNSPLIYSPNSNLLPPGAGLVVRRPAWQATVPAEGKLTQIGFKRSDGNDCAEDLEALSYIQRSPWEIWYNPAMQMRHKIPPQRLDRNYLIPHFRSIGLSRFATRMIRFKPWQRSMIWAAFLLNDSQKLLRHCWQNRSQLRQDLVTDCETTLYLYSLLSPFYLLHKAFKKL